MTYTPQIIYYPSLPCKQMQQKTLLIVKPDGVRKRLVGAVLSRFERAGFTIVELKKTKLTKVFVRKLYAHLQPPRLTRKLFNVIVNYLTEGPVVIAILQRENAVKKARQLAGPTDPSKAKKGTIRGDFAKGISLADCVRACQPVQNIVHCSGSITEAKQEIKLIRQF